MAISLHWLSSCVTFIMAKFLDLSLFRSTETFSWTEGPFSFNRLNMTALCKNNITFFILMLLGAWQFLLNLYPSLSLEGIKSKFSLITLGFIALSSRLSIGWRVEERTYKMSYALLALKMLLKNLVPKVLNSFMVNKPFPGIIVFKFLFNSVFLWLCTINEVVLLDWIST